jgi:hypothetical protein
MKKRILVVLAILGFIFLLLFSHWLLYRGWVSFGVDLPNEKSLWAGVGYPLASPPNKGGFSFDYTGTYDPNDPELIFSIGQIKDIWEENGRDYEDMWWAVSPQIKLHEFHIIFLVLYPDGNLERYDFPR